LLLINNVRDIDVEKHGHMCHSVSAQSDAEASSRSGKACFDFFPGKTRRIVQKTNSFFDEADGKCGLHMLLFYNYSVAMRVAYYSKH
jgi:hypothetical protein